MIRCQTTGPVEVTVGGQPAPPELLWRKHLALLIVLARAPRRTRAREQLTGLLWAEKAESAARHSLNEALRVVRRAAVDDALDTRGDQVTLGDGMVELDLDAVERLAAAGDLAGASALVVGEFLEGFAIPGASEFENWLSGERRHWAARGVGPHRVVRRVERWGRVSDTRSRCQAVASAVGRGGVESLLRGMVCRRAVSGRRRYEVVKLVRERLSAEPSAPVRALVGGFARSLHCAPAGVPSAPRKLARRPGRSADELAALLEQWNAARRAAAAHALLLADSGVGLPACEAALRVRLDSGGRPRARCWATGNRPRAACWRWPP
jgi:hypothetical protein